MLHNGNQIIFQPGLIILIAIAVWGCNTPLQSQKYFANAVKNDPIMEPIHQTALYTIYFDHALQRCVLHSAYTWGESGGGTGGTGLGVSVFSCNPQALKNHAEQLREQIDNGARYFELPVPKVEKTRPKSSKQGLQQIEKRPLQPMSPPQGQTEQSSPGLSQPAPAPPQPNSDDAGRPSLNSPTSPPTSPDGQPAPPAASKPEPGPAPTKKKSRPDTKLLQPITMP